MPSDSERELLRDEPVPPSGDEGPPPLGETDEIHAPDDTFSKFKAYLDEKLSNLKEEITDGTNKTTSAAVKKLQESEATFHFEGNKQQFKFNCSLAEQVSLAQQAVKRKRTSRVNEALGELEKQIKKRNKLIRLADKSPAGWGLVNEYLSDELASGSEDEKRIKKAEQAALRKKSLKQKRPIKSFNRSQGQRTTGDASAASTSATSTNYNTVYPRRPYPGSYVPRSKSTDICFGCGLTGHWRADCRRGSQTTAQSSTNTRPQSSAGDIARQATKDVISNVQHDKLKELANSLPSVLVESKAKNTRKKYERGFAAWRDWAKDFPEVQVIPANSLYISLFFVSLIQNGSSCAILNEIHYGLKWFHELGGYTDPCRCPLVENVLEAGKRILSMRVKKKEPITPDNMCALFDKHASASANLSDLRVLTICVLGYTGFLRFDELASLRRSDFDFESSHMRVFIEKSKTDVYRDGAWVLISRSGKATCPVALVTRYFSMAEFEPDSDEYIFRALSFLKSCNKYKLRDRASPLSYTRVREIVLEAFEAIGLKRSDYGLHSLRAGGASAAANANINDRLFKRHGRWKSEKAKDGYIKDNVDSLLSVSRALGI